MGPVVELDFGHRRGERIAGAFPYIGSGVRRDFTKLAPKVALPARGAALGRRREG
jgi:hypothetical protein